MLLVGDFSLSLSLFFFLAVENFQAEPLESLKIKTALGRFGDRACGHVRSVTWVTAHSEVT